MWIRSWISVWLGLGLLLPGVALAQAGISMDAVFEVPFEFPHRLILLQGRVNGQGPFNFVLDTGSAVSTLDEGLARRLGLVLSPVAWNGRAAEFGRVPMRTTRYAWFQIGALVVRNLQAMVLRLKRLSRFFGRPIHGTLGYDFLHQWVVRIDYPRRRVFFSRQAKNDDGQRRMGLRYRLTVPFEVAPPTFSPVFNAVRISGRPLRMALDTGFNRSVYLCGRTAQSLRVMTRMERIRFRQVVHFGGVARSATGVLGEIQLGTVRLRMPTLVVGPGYLRDGTGRSFREGLIGNELLQVFVVTLDYRNNRLVFELYETPTLMAGTR